MNKNIRSTLVLVCICAAISFLLAVTNFFTAPIISQNQAAKENEALLQVMPSDAGFELVDLSEYTLPKTVVEAYREKSGNGYVFKLSTKGYASGLEIMCGITSDGIVSGAVCTASNETWGKEKTLGDQMKGTNAQTITDVEAGATSLTVKGYRSAIQDALNSAVILSGGSADIRTPEEIFADNLATALPAANGEFAKLPITDENNAIDFIYAAANGSGFVYVSGEIFVGVDASGAVISENVDAQASALAQSKATLAKGQVAVNTADTGISEQITSVQKNAAGNYIVEVDGRGFGYNGDPDHYMKGKNIPIKICLVISSDGTILNCLTVSHQESANYGDKCGTESYYSQYTGKTAETYREVDAIAGATITTSGYRAAVRLSLEAVAILEGGAQ